VATGAATRIVAGMKSPRVRLRVRPAGAALAPRPMARDTCAFVFVLFFCLVFLFASCLFFLDTTLVQPSMEESSSAGAEATVATGATTGALTPIAAPMRGLTAAAAAAAYVIDP
jgi:hypothetical protein